MVFVISGRCMSIYYFQYVIIRTGSLELIYISLEFRWLWAAQLKSRFPAFKIFYLDFLAQGRNFVKVAKLCCGKEKVQQN